MFTLGACLFKKANGDYFTLCLCWEETEFFGGFALAPRVQMHPAPGFFSALRFLPKFFSLQFVTLRKMYVYYWNLGESSCVPRKRERARTKDSTAALLVVGYTSQPLLIKLSFILIQVFKYISQSQNWKGSFLLYFICYSNKSRAQSVLPSINEIIGLRPLDYESTASRAR